MNTSFALARIVSDAVDEILLFATQADAKQAMFELASSWMDLDEDTLRNASREDCIVPIGHITTLLTHDSLLVEDESGENESCYFQILTLNKAQDAFVR